MNEFGSEKRSCRYLHSHEGTLYPVAIVGNKFTFTDVKRLPKIIRKLCI